MALPGVRRNLAGAGFALIGVTAWVLGAVGSIGSQTRVAFLGVTLGGMLVMAGLALSLMPGCRIRHRYFED